MPITTLVLPPLVAVPIAAGLPPLSRIANIPPLKAVYGEINSAAGVVLNTVGAISDTLSNISSLLSGDLLSNFGETQQSQWGIFDDDGFPVIVAESVLSFEFKKGSEISDYPIEEGGFESFNKVQEPFDTKLTFCSPNISDFLQSVDNAQRSLDLYTIITPDVYYPFANIVNYDYRRDSRHGVTLLTVDVWVRQVRTSATTQYSSTQGQQNSGTGTGPTQPSEIADTGDNAYAYGQAPGEQVTSEDLPPANVGTASQNNIGTVQTQTVTQPTTQQQINNVAAAEANPPAPLTQEQSIAAIQKLGIQNTGGVTNPNLQSQINAVANAQNNANANGF